MVRRLLVFTSISLLMKSEHSTEMSTPGTRLAIAPNFLGWSNSLATFPRISESQSPAIGSSPVTSIYMIVPKDLKNMKITHYVGLQAQVSLT